MCEVKPTQADRDTASHILSTAFFAKSLVRDDVIDHIAEALAQAREEGRIEEAYTVEKSNARFLALQEEVKRLRELLEYAASLLAEFESDFNNGQISIHRWQRHYDGAKQRETKKAEPNPTLSTVPIHQAETDDTPEKD